MDMINLRNRVTQQYGDKVMDALDRYASVMSEQWLDYDLARTDRRELHEGQLLAIKKELQDLEGPITTLRIHVASIGDRETLIGQIECFHDVDDRLQAEFGDNLEVCLDSESSELFVFASERMAGKVQSRLESLYGTVKWTQIPQPLSLTFVRPIGNWNNARLWLKAKNQAEAVTI